MTQVTKEEKKPVSAPTSAASATPDPELVHPTEVGGELSHFTSIGKLRAGQHALDPQSTLWYLQTADGQQDVPLTQMPTWVKQALSRPPLDPAPPSPTTSKAAREAARRAGGSKAAAPPSPSSSSPEVYEVPIPE